MKKIDAPNQSGAIYTAKLQPDKSKKSYYKSGKLISRSKTFIL